MNSNAHTCKATGSALLVGHNSFVVKLTTFSRYNLKRRVASLPPLTSEIFAEKVLANQASAAATAAKASFEKICTACTRTYFSENAYQNHLQSQKHKARLLQMTNEPDLTTEAETESMMSSTFSLANRTDRDISEEEDGESDSDADEEFARVVDGIKQAHLDDGDTKEPISRRPARPHHSSASNTDTASATPTRDSTIPSTHPTLQCLFCNAVSPSIPENVIHMSKTHSLFIPEQAYLVDLPGLLSYLHDRVHALHECLYCGQLKYTAAGIQTHMRDKGHCMIAFESEAEMVEVGEFYDFRSTYSDDESDEDDSDYEPDEKRNGVKLGASRPAMYTAEDGEELNDEDEDWEEASDSEAEAASDDESNAPTRVRKARQAYEVDGELRLPSGRTAGHRSLARYYRQNLHNYPTPVERLEEQRRLLLEQGSGNVESSAESGTNPDGTLAQRSRAGRGVQTVSRANGGLGLLAAAPELRKAAAKLELKERRRADRAANQFRAGNERRGNQQKHYRDPLLQ